MFLIIISGYFYKRNCCIFKASDKYGQVVLQKVYVPKYSQNHPSFDLKCHGNSTLWMVLSQDKVSSSGINLNILMATFTLV